jgi:hypothetical protein
LSSQRMCKNGPGSSAKRYASGTARARNRHFRRLSALCAHTKAPYKIDFLWKTLRGLNRPSVARTNSASAPREERETPFVANCQ